MEVTVEQREIFKVDIWDAKDRQAACEEAEEMWNNGELDDASDIFVEAFVSDLASAKASLREKWNEVSNYLQEICDKLVVECDFVRRASVSNPLDTTVEVVIKYKGQLHSKVVEVESFEQSLAEANQFLNEVTEEYSKKH